MSSAASYYASAARAVGAGSRGLSTAASTPSSSSAVDTQYPGTAVMRRANIIQRAQNLTKAELSQDWESVRKRILWAGGLWDRTDVQPGYGYTGHSFNDYNHCDLCAMNDEVNDNQNEGLVEGIAYGNKLGEGIRRASIDKGSGPGQLGPGGSWSTCMQGCNSEPPRDVAHLQFRARIAFKLVWCPPSFTTFVLVGDGGELLNTGKPNGGNLPSLRQRQYNFMLVRGSKYALEAEKAGAAAAVARDEL